MKLLIILALTIAVTSGKPIAAEDPVAMDVNAWSNIMTFLNGMDPVIQSKLREADVKAYRLFVDPTKSLGERYNEMAKLTEEAAVLYHQASKKYYETHPSTPLITSVAA